MDIELLLRVGGIGFIIAVLAQILNKLGREDIANLLSVCGIVTVIALLLGGVGDLVDTVKEIFEL